MEEERGSELKDFEDGLAEGRGRFDAHQCGVERNCKVGDGQILHHRAGIQRREPVRGRGRLVQSQHEALVVARQREPRTREQANRRELSALGLPQEDQLVRDEQDRVDGDGP